MSRSTTSRIMVVAIMVASLIGHREGVSREKRADPGGRDPSGTSGPVDSRESIRTMLRDGNYAEAEAAARKLLGVIEASAGPDALETARVLDLLVESFWRGGSAESPEARRLAERAVSIKEKALGPDHLEVASSLQNEAALFRTTASYAAARPLYDRAVAITEKNLGADHPDLARPLYNLACLLVEMGRFSEARPLFDRALGLTEKALGPDHLNVALVLNAHANLLALTGDYAAARAGYERALAIREKVLGPTHHEVASTLNNFANLLREMGDFAGSRRHYERALALREKAFGPEHPLVAQTLFNFARLLMDTGDYREARAMYERSLEVRQKALGAEHPEVADTLQFLAAVHQAAGGRDEARVLLERALVIREKTLGPDNYDVAFSLDRLATLAWESGDRQRARSLCERALAIREKLLGPDHPEVAESLRHLALFQEGGAGYAGSASLYARALAIEERALGPEHPALADTLADYANLLAGTGQEEKALDLALRAEEVARDHIRLTARALSERQALHYASVKANGLDLALSLAARGSALSPGGGPRAWDSLIRSRALVLDEMAERHNVAGIAGDPEVARLAREVAAARGRLAHLVVRGVPREFSEGYRGLLDEARSQAEKAERALAERSLAFRETLDRQTVGLTEVAASLPPRSAIVAFALYDRSGPSAPGPAYAALLLPPGGKTPRVVPLGPAPQIEDLVSRWRREIARGATAADRGQDPAEADYRKAGAALRSRVWDPLVPALGSPGRVFVVPDGVLSLVNFAALPVGDSGYVVESGPSIHYLSAERDLAHFSGASGPGDGLLVLGDPAFDDASYFAASARSEGDREPDQSGISVAGTARVQRSGCSGFGALRFEPLPASAAEAEEVARLWRRSGASPGRRGRVSGGADTPGADVTLLRGVDASEAAFKKMAPGKRVLHLATHGFFLSGDCPSALRPLRGIGGLAFPPDDAAFDLGVENPLLLSGLALGGANHRAEAGPQEEDGILTAEEIAALRLSGVEWAVLSGCDTGLGAVKAGEGVLGLRRAFQVAGARTVIMSLWPVGDEPARDWMRALYAARFGEHLDTPQAVRRATLTELRRMRESGAGTHPFFWAGFVATGDWR